jgi:hypothetical protein
MTPVLSPQVRWPALIVGALVIHVVASLVTVFIATSDPSYAVEEDYYQKALAWDERRAQEGHNRELGWQLDVEVAPPPAAGSDPTLVVRLADGNGQPLDGARIAVAAFHNARAGQTLRAEPAAVGAGAYACPLAMHRSGVWELRFTVGRDGERFTRTVRRHLNLEPR